MDLVEYLESLGPDKVEQFYRSPTICRVILQGLPSLACQYVTRFLLVPDGISEALLSAWPQKEAASAHNTAVQKLLNLGLLHAQPNKLGATIYTLDEAFRLNINQSALQGLFWTEDDEDSGGAVPVNPEALRHYATRRWEDVLLFVVGENTSFPAAPAGLPKLDLPRLLRSLELVQAVPGQSKLQITDRGFKFLLMDLYQQLWLVLRQYAFMVESQELSLAEVLEFLIQLSSQPGLQLDLGSLPSDKQRIAGDLAQLGLLMPLSHAGKIGRRTLFIPTHLASLIGKGNQQMSAAQGYVIVETNFRVYAYTSSAVQQAILRFFVRCDVLLPNLFVGSITRESVMEALESGTSGEQIIEFLRSHAHPRTVSRSPQVPIVVTDQIRLWDRELQRLKAQRSVLYANFESPELFQEFLAAVGHLAQCVNRDKQQVVVPSGAHETCKAEIRRLKTKLGL